MVNTRIKLSSIIENQLPNFIKEEFPLAEEFLSQYYISIENTGGPLDIIQNIDLYTKVDNLTNLVETTTLETDISFSDSTIIVSSTLGFPEKYGLILIDSEIITYTSKTEKSFNGCVRGFSGVTSYRDKKKPDQLIFTSSVSEDHIKGTEIKNLSILFLKEFFNKLKKQFLPGFEERSLDSSLNQSIFLKQSKDFYSSKGTDSSFEILFKALYGEDIKVIKPRDFLIEASNAQYRVTQDLIVEAIEGDPTLLINGTLYQDKTEYFDKASGTITNIEKIIRGGKDYYVISFDYDYDKDVNVSGTVFGKFSIHPKTKIVTDISDNSSFIDVDSTAGFPSSGALRINLENGGKLSVNYEKKTLTQFLGCSGIIEKIPAGTEVCLDAYAYGYIGSSKDKVVKVRITGALSDLEIPKNAEYYTKDDSIEIKTLGVDLTDYKSSNWFYNIAISYETETINLIDSSDSTYRFKLYDNHSLHIGDFISIIPSAGGIGEENYGVIVSIEGKKSFTARVLKNNSLPVRLSNRVFYTVKKILSRVNSSNYPELNVYTSNIQNTYIDDQKSLYVATPSLPTYLDQPLEINNRSVTFSGSFNGEILNIGPHGFYTGDSIVYVPEDNKNKLNLPKGIYFVYRVNETSIKLARSRQNIFTNTFIEVVGNVTNNRFDLSAFVYSDLNRQSLEPQKLIRKFEKPQNDGKLYETDPGSVGIFINGVELLNYKSEDLIYYGPIEEINAIANGSDYDIINPPIVEIIDSVGTEASAYCSVDGSLERIDIIDPGFDYLDTPIITISGGNGKDAKAEVNLVQFDHSVSFYSNTSSGVNTNTNTIIFPSYHKFRDNEKVIYDSEGQSFVGGLSSGSIYFANLQDEYSIRLHKSLEDCVSGINTINITSYGTGQQLFKSATKKNKISSITIKDAGIGYQNKKRTVSIAGISTVTSTITIKKHGYSNGEIVKYYSGDSSIGGLIDGNSYYILKLNENQFRLAEFSSNQNQDFLFKTNQFIKLTSTGSGNHTFNYPEITVEVKGRIGVTTFNNQDYNAILQPIFRGKIDSVFVESEGENYGSEEIINYNRQPQILLNSGSGAQLTPVILDGKIVNILINNSGSGYNSPPNLIIRGTGKGCLLTPIIEDGSIIEVKIISTGGGFGSDTVIDVVPAGFGAKFESKIKSWRINLVERMIRSNQITNDDGILYKGLNSEYGLQYTHLYSPRKLRSSVLSTKIKDGQIVYVPDIQILDNKESDSTAHSPIIGWAYDGNPIYGPYGYTSPTGGVIRSMKSGYIQRLKNNRPSTELYPLGFFIEDYEYSASGDLDENNGRFCITPEYPNGIYAYFCTISDLVESSGAFINYKKPAFPYAIGNYFRSKPISFNFDVKSNQDNIDINSKKWLRNTNPYNLNSSNSSYEFIFNPNKIKKQVSKVKNTTLGGIDFVGILTGGKDYKVGDQITFHEETLGKGSAFAKISHLKGKEVETIAVSKTTTENIEFETFNGGTSFVGFASSPHNLLNNDIVTVTTQYNNKSECLIKVNANILTLSSGVGTTSITGIITYFNVSGNLSEIKIRENDVYLIENEQVKVLSIDSKSSRIRVLRKLNGNVSISSYSAGTTLTEIPRKFQTSFPITTYNDFNVNKEIYFNPKESIGLGISSGDGVGIGTTIYFSNPGVGNSSLRIPTKSIYLPNHNLKTGTKLFYSANGSNRVSVSTDGLHASTFLLSSSQPIYSVKLSEDLIGISTFKIGIGSTGSYVGTGLTTSNTLYFHTVGTGENHSFKTDYENVLTGKFDKNIISVTTSDDHQLSIGDKVAIDVTSGESKTIKLQYDDNTRRLVTNKKEFDSTDVDSDKNIIRIDNHSYYTGQKLLYRSNSSTEGLVDGEMYFAVVVDDNRFKLTDTLYESKRLSPNVVSFSEFLEGTLFEVNPPLRITKNSSIIFDLSDSSLSYSQNSIDYSAFDLKLYTDSQFRKEFNSTERSFQFNIVKSGRIGVDEFANVTVYVDEFFPENLYYKLIPVNLEYNTEIKKEIIVDSEVTNNNQIIFKSSVYNGEYIVSGITSNTFNCNILNTPEKDEYLSNTSEISYITNSVETSGPIAAIDIIRKGKYYDSIPGISSIISENGTGAILVPQSKEIGRIKSYDIQDIGFNYSADLSIRPIAKLPSVLKIESFSSIDSITVNSLGKNYISPPNLIVVDGYTNKIVSGIDLEYKLDSKNVRILKNVSNINNINPRIIPINNTNGVGISTIVYNSASKDVVVTLGSSFSDQDDFPFEVGDEVLIENISVGINSTGKGYNSKNYDYAFFKILNIDANIGGIGATILFNMTDHLDGDQLPGEYDSINSAGRIVPVKHMPTFDVLLKNNTFFEDEVVYTLNSKGKVESWDSENKILKVSSPQEFYIGDILVGESSNSQAIISDVISTDSVYNVDAHSNVRKGWKKETGVLNNTTQRIHDSDYYQFFSYAINSHVDLSEWKDIVENLNHTLGFKKFGDLLIDSSPSYSGISTEQNSGDFVGISNLYSVIDLHCINDFDLAKENLINIDGNTKSNKIIFGNTILQDYIESVGNRVLIIDDISDQFSSIPRSEVYSEINAFKLDDYRFKKYLTYVQDTRFNYERQISFVNVLHDNSTAYVNQYGKVFTEQDLGSFDFSISDQIGTLQFYPTNSRINEYGITITSFSLGNLIGISTNLYTITKDQYQTTSVNGTDAIFEVVKDGINYEVTIIDGGIGFLIDDQIKIKEGFIGGENRENLLILSISQTDLDGKIESISITKTPSTNVGDIVKISSNSILIPSGSSSSEVIVGIASTYRSSKILVQIGSTDRSYYESNEISIIHDGSDVRLLEYGSLNTRTLSSNVGVGLGSYSAVIDEDVLNILFTPYEELTNDIKVGTLSISISDSSKVGVGSTVFGNGIIKSSYTSIPASSNPSGSIISQYDSEYNSGYFIVTVEDSTNNQYQTSEILSITGESSSSMVEFASLYTNVSIGTHKSEKVGSNTNLIFTPNPNTQVKVRVFQVSLNLLNDPLVDTEIDLDTNSINFDYSLYRGTEIDVRRDFELRHKQKPIFERYFDGGDSSIVNVESNSISLPEHFFVSGEEIDYSFGDEFTNSPISIIDSGIGTDKLPSTVYVVKVDDTTIKLAATAEDALLTIPSTLEFSSVGVGASHKFTSKNQNSKVIIGIDNIIQTPIVSTAITETSLNEIKLSDAQIVFSGISSFFSGDLIKIDDEIMKVTTVGLGTTNVVAVQRAWMGTGISTHSENSIIRKVTGDFNIIDNKIHFIEAPYGKIPFFEETDRPDEIDYVGLETGSFFNGRVFLRSGIPGSVNESYSTNYIFDDIRDSILGITTIFTLKNNGENITGISTSNSILLVNNIFQSPSRISGSTIDGNYTITEVSGVSSIRFSGNPPLNEYDVNTSSAPIGGVILSIGTTSGGFGYQPIISAGGTCTVSMAGTISEVSIGNTGSGYRINRKYEIISNVSTNVGIGSTIITIDNKNSIFAMLNIANTGENCKISIGTYITDSTITSIGSTSITISTASTISKLIPNQEPVIVSIANSLMNPIGFVNVSVANSSVGILTATHIGIATIQNGKIKAPVIITNPGVGYSSQNVPVVIFDHPTPYSDLPLDYSYLSSGYDTYGKGATVDIVVGQGSSVIDFQIKNYGYGYRQNEILRVDSILDTPFGVPVDENLSQEDFNLYVDSTFTDKVNGWVVGDLQVFDPIDNLFDGNRISFPLSIEGNQTTIRSRKGSLIDVEATLLIFINDILQVPGQSYIFDGGSVITFEQPPKEGDTSKIIFYRGTGGIDTIDVDIRETIKVGDDVILDSDNSDYQQGERTVSQIISTDEVETIVYPGPGISLDQKLIRPLTWCKQTEDRIVNGQYVSKDRVSYEPLVYPVANVIKSVGIDTETYIFVDNIKTFFDNYSEYGEVLSPKPQVIQIISQSSTVSAAATAIISSEGSISSIDILDGGEGYTEIPTVIIESPIGIGTRSTANANISIGGTVSSITVVNPGSGYTSTNPPNILIESPKYNTETISNVEYEGDFGIITQISIPEPNQITFDFYIPQNSSLRNPLINNVGMASTGVSSIQNGYYFTIYNSNIGNGLTSLDSSGNIIGVGTTHMDNIYQANSVLVTTKNIPGIGVTYVTQVTTTVETLNGFGSIGEVNFYGEFSWGRIHAPIRKTPKSFEVYDNGNNLSPIVRRVFPLKYRNYYT